MSTLIQAAETIRQFAQQYHSLAEAATVLDSLGSLKNAEAEAKKATEKAKAELQALRDEIANMTAESAASLTATKEEAEKINIDIATKLQFANEEAARILSDAKGQAQEHVAHEKIKCTSSLVTSKKKQQDAEEAANVALDELNAINTQKASAEAELTALQAKLDSTKDSLRKLLGDG